MNPRKDPHRELDTDEMSETRVRLIQDLEHAYRPHLAPPRVDAVVIRALHERRNGQNGEKRLKLPTMTRLLRPRAVALIAALSLVLAGALTYLHGQTVQPVSAQTVLNRSAVAGLVPNEATHFTYRLTASNGLTGTSDEWIAADAGGVTTRLALSNAVQNGGTLVPGLSERLIQQGETARVYDPASNTVTVSPSGQIDEPWQSIVIGTRLVQKLGGAAQATPLRQKLAASSVRRQTLDGNAVYVLPLSSNGDQTLYVDAHSYIPRGADWTENGVSWHARLLQYGSMALSATPSDAFSLGAPASAKVIQAQSDKSEYPVDLGDALATACKTTAASFKAALAQSPDQTMLTACQQTNPSITLDQLRNAVLASVRNQLDAAVTAGQITSDQEQQQLDETSATITDKLTAAAGNPGTKSP